MQNLPQDTMHVHFRTRDYNDTDCLVLPFEQAHRNRLSRFLSELHRLIYSLRQAPNERAIVSILYDGVATSFPQHLPEYEGGSS